MSSSELLHRPVIQGVIPLLALALCLARLGADDLDLQLSGHTGELRNARATLGSCLFDLEDRVLV